jgi:hypothetical protein
MSDSDRNTWNTYYGPQVGGGGGGGARAKIDPRTLPDYNPGAMYDDYGNITGAFGPYGGPTTGGPNVGYSAVGAPNSAASGVGYTGVTDSEGPGVASIGGFGDRGKGIYSDASAYLGGDFQGGGSGDFAFGGAPTENIQGSPVADLSQNPLSPMDPNATMYDGGPGGHFETSYGYDGSPSTQWVPNSGGGIGSDAGATRGRIAEIIAGGGGGGALPAVGPLPGDIGSTPMSNQNPNIGYNPGMENFFANPGMRQYNPDALQRQLQDILQGIDRGTANQNLDPNTGRSFYQGDNLQPQDYRDYQPQPDLSWQGGGG